MVNRLAGKNAVIVGGGSGIGASIARSLHQAEVRVAIGGRRLASLEETAEGTSICYQTVDASDRTSAEAFFRWAEQALGPIDILVIAAGVNIRNRSMAEMTPDDWDRLIGINATGAYHCMYFALPGMRARKTGTILNISSVAGKRALALGGVAYSASKFAMTALGTCVANEVAPDGVRVVNLYPGEVNTPILENRPVRITEQHRQSILQPDEVAELVMAVLNLPDSVHVPELVIKPLSQVWY